LLADVFLRRVNERVGAWRTIYACVIGPEAAPRTIDDLDLDGDLLKVDLLGD
jgi:hypothetical protein